MQCGSMRYTSDMDSILIHRSEASPSCMMIISTAIRDHTYQRLHKLGIEKKQKKKSKAINPKDVQLTALHVLFGLSLSTDNCCVPGAEARQSKY